MRRAAATETSGLFSGASLVLVRSVRAGGDTKTRKSRRGVELAQRAMVALRVLWEARPCSHELMPDCTCLVIVTRTGNPMGARNVQRDFRKVIDTAGLVGREWTPRELRQSFVSLLSSERSCSGCIIQQIL